MGVPGLWELLRPAAARTSLSTLAKEGFAANRRGLRAFTIGIDASLWIFHAQLPQHGENPFLRTIFFKLTTLLQQPILPVFVFDGPDKPRMKRGARVAGKFGTHDRRSIEFKRLLDECGLVYWNAPGEAEAELALMNRQGKIDAVMSDDGDALLFGAKCLIRNNSATLSGTKASQHVSATKGDLKTYEIFRSDAICAEWTADEGTVLKTEEDCRLTMVWIALLAGGDYVPEGIDTFGHKIAFGLARAGISSDLALYTSDRPTFLSSLPSLQERMIHELRTNSTGQIGRKNPARAKSLAALEASEVVNLDALDSYMQPKTSGDDPSRGWQGFTTSGRGGTGRNGGRGDIEGLARACERFFEWGTRDLVVKRFVSESVGTFGSDIVNDARCRVMKRDQAEVPTTAKGGQNGRLQSFFPVVASATPFEGSKGSSTTANVTARSTDSSYPNYIVKIERTRSDPTNAELIEYRIQYRTDGFIKRVHRAMDGSRVDPKNLSTEERAALGMKAIEQDEADEDEPAKADKGLARLWIADWLVREAWPDLVREWEEAEAAKAKPKGKSHSRTASASSATSKGTLRAKKGLRADGEDVNGFTAFFSSQAGVQAGASARSFRRTTSAPSGSSTMRSFGTTAPSGGLAPIGEVSRLSSPAKASPVSGDATSSTNPGPAPRTFGRTISVPVHSLGTSSRGNTHKSVVDWTFKDDMFIDSDGEFDFAPVAAPDRASDRASSTTPQEQENRSGVPLPDSTMTAVQSDRTSSSSLERTRPIAGPSNVKTAPREIIDLCSSSEDEEPIENKPPTSRPTRKSALGNASKTSSTVLRDSSRGNSQPPMTIIPSTKTKCTSHRPPTSSKSSRQATLSFPVTASAQSATPAHAIKHAARLAATPTPTKIKPKKGRKSYIVQEEDDELVVIDSTRGGVNLKGYEYNP